MVSLQCAGVMCLIFGIFSGVTSPAGICGISVGCAILCCCPQDHGCMRCGAITGIIFAAIQLIACIGGGAYVLANVHAFCDLATAIVSGVCSSSGSSGRLLLSNPAAQPYLPSLPASTETHVDSEFFKRALDASHVALFAAFTSGAHAFDNVASMIDHADAAPDGRRLETDSCGSSTDGDCDDGGPGSEYSICTTGTDCTDCGRANCDQTVTSSSGSDSCTGRNGNGVCEDGIGGSPANCPYCTDYSDCGARTTNDCNGCSTAPGAVNDTCDTVKTIGYAVIIAGAIIHICLIVGFSFVLSGTKKLMVAST